MQAVVIPTGRGRTGRKWRHYRNAGCKLNKFALNATDVRIACDSFFKSRGIDQYEPHISFNEYTNESQ